MTHPLALLNSPVVTTPGNFDYATANAGTARELAREYGIASYVRHPGTAEALGELLGMEVPTSTNQLAHQPGQIALVFTPNQRLETGVILDRQQIEEIGYTLGFLTRNR